MEQTASSIFLQKFQQLVNTSQIVVVFWSLLLNVV